MKIRLFDAMIDQKYGVTVYELQREVREELLVNMREWCCETFGISTKHRYIPAKWKQSFGTFYFITEKQRTLFLLRWS